MRKKSQKSKEESISLEEYINNYDRKSLIAAAQTIQNSFAWNLLKAFLKLKQREMEVASLDLVGQDGNSYRAAKASGIALGFEEVSDKLIPELIDLILGNNGVVEDPRPEDVQVENEVKN